MENYILVLGLVGSIASIIGLFFKVEYRKTWIAITILAFTGLAIIAVQQYSYVSRLEDISRNAAILVDTREMRFTDDGFVHAALTFLEKHRYTLPDTYRRAVALCENRGCFERAADSSGSTLRYSTEMIYTASVMEGIVRSLLSSEDAQSIR